MVMLNAGGCLRTGPVPMQSQALPSRSFGSTATCTSGSGLPSTTVFMEVTSPVPRVASSFMPTYEMAAPVAVTSSARWATPNVVPTYERPPPAVQQAVYTVPSQAVSTAAPLFMQVAMLPAGIPLDDTHPAEIWYRDYLAKQQQGLVGLTPREPVALTPREPERTPTPSARTPTPPPREPEEKAKPVPKAKWALAKPQPAPKKEGIVQKIEHKISDAVHGVEKAVMDKVHGVENAVMDKVHSVENAVTDTIHGVENSVVNKVHAVEDAVVNKVHGVENAVMNKVHGVENAVMNKVHGVENAVQGAETAVMNKVHGAETAVMDEVHSVENAAHNVSEKVHGFFSSIGGLFHRGSASDGKDAKSGPGGSSIGKGSSVEVKQEGSSVKRRGHVVSDRGSDGCFDVQFHTDPKGQITRVPESKLMHVDSFVPSVGSGVEVLHEGKWHTAYVIALPSNDTKGMWTCQCHDDPIGMQTFAADDAIRPWLSKEEQAIVKDHLSNGGAEDKKAAAEAKKQAVQQARDEFKKTLFDNDLGAFHAKLVEHGYDDASHVEHLSDEELQEFGMKSGHLNKFHSLFPRGSTYVVYNGDLQSDIGGLGFRATKDMGATVHKLAEWDSKVQGVDQGDGWLKVGTKYLPIKMDGKLVLYLESAGPPKPKGTLEKVEGMASGAVSGLAHMLHLDSGGEQKEAETNENAPPSSSEQPAPGVAAKAEAAVEKAEGAVSECLSGALHGFAHMMHMDAPADSPPRSQTGGGEQKGVEIKDKAPASSSEKPAPKFAAKSKSTVRSNSEKPASGVAAKAEAAVEKAEGAVSGALHGFAHMMHMDAPAESPSNSRSGGGAQKGVETTEKKTASSREKPASEVAAKAKSPVASNREKPSSGVAAKAEAAVEKAEGAVSGALHGFAHMMHMDAPADSPPSSQSGGMRDQGGEPGTSVTEATPAPSTPAAPAPSNAEPTEGVVAKTEEAVSGALHGLAHMMHMDAPADSKPPSLQSKGGEPGNSAAASDPAPTAPAAPAPSNAEPTEGVVAKTEEAVSGVLHGFAHMLHMDAPADPPPADPPSPASTEKAFPATKEDFSPGPIEDASPSRSAAKSEPSGNITASKSAAKASPPKAEESESTLHKAESAVGGMMHRFGHMLHFS